MVEPSGNTVSMSVWSESLILCDPPLAGFSRAIPGTGVCFCSFPHFGILDSSTWQSPLTLLPLCEMLHPLLWKLWEHLTATEDQRLPWSESPCGVTRRAHSTARWHVPADVTPRLWVKQKCNLAFSFKWPSSLVCIFLNKYCCDLLRNLVGAMCSLWRNIARSCSC